MNDQELFRSRLLGIDELAAARDRVLTESEIRDHFQGISLTPEQWDLVYQYIEGRRIHIAGRGKAPGIVLMPEDLTDASGEENEAETDQVLDLILQDIRRIPPALPGEEEQLLERLIRGDVSARDRLSELYQYNVLAIAKEYVNDNLSTTDLIQEGNIGLLTGISMLPEIDPDTAPADYLIGSIREAMELYILDQGDSHSFSKEIEAKVNKLKDAILELEEDLGQKVSKAELSAFLGMPLEEIDEVKRLAGDDLDI